MAATAPHLLPGDALALTLSYLGSTLETCGAAELRATCPKARISAEVARGLADHLRLALPKKTARTTRAQAGDPFVILAATDRRRIAAERAARDRVAWALWIAFHDSDCAARLRRALRADPALATHRIASFEHRTLLFCAAWRGRPSCVDGLLEAGADANARDARDCTPLIVASWAGRDAVVYRLLEVRGIDLYMSGETPQTSSCGNRGSANAHTWARRKNHGTIARLIERHI
jgi:hypothetical protein